MPLLPVPPRFRCEGILAREQRLGLLEVARYKPQSCTLQTTKLHVTNHNAARYKKATLMSKAFAAGVALPDWAADTFLADVGELLVSGFRRGGRPNTDTNILLLITVA